jgi:hypothetical protein
MSELVTSACGCCDPEAPLTPLMVENRPELFAVAYRIGTYASFRESMLQAIPAGAGLAGLATREDDDFAVTVLDLWAAVADVLTFYQERYANEAFLRTATRRESVRRLAELIGYRLAPGAAVLTLLAFTLESGQALALPASLRVQSVPGQGAAAPRATPAPAAPGPVAGPAAAPQELPQTFETLTPLSADARFNRLRVFDTPAGPGPLAAGQAEAVLDRAQGPAIAASLHPGDRVVLWADGQTTRAEEKQVREVRLQDDQAIVAWTQPVAETTWSSSTSARRFTRVMRLFGHDAPANAFTLAADPSSLGAVKWVQGTTSYAYPQTAAETSAVAGTSLLCLDGRVEGIAAGDRLLVADTGDTGSTLMVTVQASDQVQDSLGGVTTSVTRLRVAPALAATDRRYVRIYQLVGPAVAFWTLRYPPSVAGTTLFLPGRRVQDAAGPGVEVGRGIEQGAFTAGLVIHPGEVDVGRQVILTDATGRAVPGTVQAAPVIQPLTGSPGSFCHLVITVHTDEPPALDAASAVLLGNVAPASHGETTRGEVVGDGDASREFQRLPLRKTPLTYVPAGGPDPLATSLQVQVDGIRWQEVPSLYGRGPTDRVLVTRTGDDGRTMLQFGDGRTGARVPTGQGNVVATYRTGTGLAGRLGAGALTTALDRPRGLKSVQNPVPATGGADPETMEDARDNAPRTVRTFGRIVSLHDFTDQVRATGEVAKADARWIWDGFDRAVFLTIAAQEAELLGAQDLRRLAASLAAVRDTNHRMRIANFTPVPVRLQTVIRTDPAVDPGAVTTAARAAVLAALSFDRMSLAQSVHLSDLYAVLQSVPGVLSADIDVLMFKQPAGMTAAQFDASLTERGAARLPDGTPQPVQGHLRIFPARPSPPPGTVVRPAELAVVESPGQDITITQMTGGSS